MLKNNSDYLYLQIAASIRRDIENGLFKPGDVLPPIRDLTLTWHCTIGTVQRAIQELVAEGLVTTHVGKRTRFIGSAADLTNDSLRRANLIHRAETFLLEVMSSGFDASEAEDAFRVALNRWQSVSHALPRTGLKNLQFKGSHDLAVAWIATHFNEISTGYQLHLEFVGSMSGLEALEQGRCEIAGLHIQDAQTGLYNKPIVESFFPNESMVLVTLAQRRLGLITKNGNPLGIHSIENFARPEVRYVNRNPGSGTRIYLDSLLKSKGISSEAIHGYGIVKNTHSEVAAEVGEDHADVGIGLEAAARSFDLDFQFLTLERYDLVMRQQTFQLPAIQSLIEWLRGSTYRQLLKRLGGYESELSGSVQMTQRVANAELPVLG